MTWDKCSISAISTQPVTCDGQTVLNATVLLDKFWADLGVVDMDAEFSWDQVVFDHNSDIEMVV